MRGGAARGGRSAAAASASIWGNSAAITIGARRFTLKSASSAPARTVTYTAV